MGKRHRDLETGFATLEEAVNSYRVAELKELAALIVDRPPTRQVELVAVILGAMAGDSALKLWERLGGVDRQAVAEAVHSPQGFLDRDRFMAKYGRMPDLVVPYTRASNVQARPSLASLFIYQGVWLPRDLQARLKGFVPEPRPPDLATAAELPATVAVGWPEYDLRTGTRETKQTEAVPLVWQETAAPALHDVVAVLRLVI